MVPVVTQGCELREENTTMDSDGDFGPLTDANPSICGIMGVVGDTVEMTAYRQRCHKKRKRYLLYPSQSFNCYAVCN